MTTLPTFRHIVFADESSASRFPNLLPEAMRHIVKCRVFANGERQIWLGEQLHGHALLVVENLPENLWEACQMLAAARAAGATGCWLMAPFLAYQRQDKHEELLSGHAPAIAPLMGQLFRTAGADGLLLAAPHSPALLHAWQHNLPVVELPVFQTLLRSIIGNISETKLVLVAPDQGMAAHVEALAQAHNLPFALLKKSRNQPNQVESLAPQLGAEYLPGAAAIVLDDMLDTGGTLEAAIACCRSHGCSAVHLGVVHGLFSGGAAARMNKAAPNSLWVMDTQENASYAADEMPLHLIPLSI